MHIKKLTASTADASRGGADEGYKITGVGGVGALHCQAGEADLGVVPVLGVEYVVKGGTGVTSFGAVAGARVAAAGGRVAAAGKRAARGAAGGAAICTNK